MASRERPRKFEPPANLPKGWFKETRVDKSKLGLPNNLTRGPQLHLRYSQLLASSSVRKVKVDGRVRYDLTIEGWIPARLNEFIGRHWSVMYRAKKFDRDIVMAAAAGCGSDIPAAKGKRRVSVAIYLSKDRKEADPDAYWKSLLDALVHAGLLVDDSPKWCVLGAVQQFPSGNYGCRTVIKLTDLE